MYRKPKLAAMVLATTFRCVSKQQRMHENALFFSQREKARERKEAHEKKRKIYMVTTQTSQEQKAKKKTYTHIHIHTTDSKTSVSAYFVNKYNTTA